MKSEDRLCNKQHIFNSIIKNFELINGELYRKFKSKPGSRRVVGSLRGEWYLSCTLDHYQLFVHNVIMILKTQAKIPDGMVIDHIDGDPFNNRLENLRIVTPKINCDNSKVSKASRTGYANIGMRKDGRYRVCYASFGKTIDLGRFDTLARAVEARNKSYAINAPEKLASVMRRGG